jgi:hypothetical protein
MKAMMKTNFNIDNKEEMGKPKQSLSFVEQLQSQIQLCREAVSEPELPLSPKVEESLTPYIRQRAKQQFKAIMIFIDKKGYMPIEKNE